MHTTLLIIHFIGMAMGVGFSITIAVQGAIAEKLPPEIGGPAMGIAARASVLGPIGLVLLIGSGAAMIGDMPAELSSMGFLTKMVLVTLLTGLIIGTQYNGIMAQKTADGGPPNPVLIGKARAFGKVALPVSILIIITAVITFN